MNGTATDLVQWTGDDSVRFFLSSKEMRLFEDLKVTAEAETEDKVTGKAGYKELKKSKAAKIECNAMLFATLGVDVQKVAMAMLSALQKGKTGYFKIQGKKLLNFAFLITKAAISDIEMTPRGKWISCKVALTFEQSEIGGSGGDSTPGTSPGTGRRYYGYCYWAARTRGRSGWTICVTTPQNKSLYTQDVTINGKLYHGYKPSTTTTTTTDTDDSPYPTTADYT